MVDSDEFPSGKEDERAQRLIRDLRRMYHSKGEAAQRLARVRERLEESSAHMPNKPATAPQQQSTQWEEPGRVNGARSNYSERRTWQQRMSIIAATLFVTLLVGSLIVVLARARQNNSNASGTARQFEALSSIHMLDAQTGWALTEKGRVIRTTDGGIHWQNVTPQYHSTAGQQKVVAEFFTFAIAWIAVSNTAADGTTTVSVFRTTDGGQTWQETAIPQISPIFQITFVDAQHGWALSKRVDLASAEAVNILRTTDGGKTWAIVSSALAASTDTPPRGQLPFGGDKAGMGFVDTTTGWITGNFPLQAYVFFYDTHDGGATWNRQTLPFPPDKASTQIATRPPRFFTATDGILPVSFVTENAASLDLYVTHDSGVNWTSTTPIAASAAVSDVIDMNHGWASDGTLLYVTSDGGQNWTKLSPGGGFQHVTRLNFVSSNTGWAIGATGSHVPTLLKTVDGGKTWTAIPYTIS